MKLSPLVLVFALSACQQAPQRTQAVGQRPMVAVPFAGRILDSGSRGKFGEISALRSRSGSRVSTAIAFDAEGLNDPATGEATPVTVHGYELDCDSGQSRITYYRGLFASGEVAYDVKSPTSEVWRSDPRANRLIELLCAESTDSQTDFTGVTDFLRKTHPPNDPVPVVKTPDN